MNRSLLHPILHPFYPYRTLKASKLATVQKGLEWEIKVQKYSSFSTFLLF